METTLEPLPLDDYDDVDGVRICLWTAATKGPIVHQVIYEHGEPWRNDTDRGKLLIRPIELTGDPTGLVIH
jgi:hypothetical protein